MPSRLLHLPRRVSLSLREEPRRRASRIRIVVASIEPENSTSTSPTSSSCPPRGFPPRDAYSAARALALSLSVTSVGSAGVGSLANWLFGALSLPLADARALAAFAVEGAQLASVLLIASSSSSQAAGKFSFDFRDGRVAAAGLAGGLAAVAAVSGVDFLLATSSLSSASSSPSEATATSVAASALSKASSPFFRAALLSASCVFAPATEELVFRGFVLRGLLLGRLRGGSAVLAAATAFAASHFSVLLSDGARGEVPKELLLLFILGLVLGATATWITEDEGREAERGGSGEGGGGSSSLAEKRGERERQKSSDSFNLAAPALAHALYNAAAYFVAAAAG
jgi:membrane protease YdiL (CAAX protease family)